MSPEKTPFLVVTIFFLVMAVVCFAQGIVGGGVACAVMGVLGLSARSKAKKNSDNNSNSNS